MTPSLPPPSNIPHRATLGRLINQSTVLLMGSIGALILILALLILFHENANATKGYRLRGLERERTMLLLEQEVLKMQIAESQSLSHLKDDIQVQQMIAVKKPRYTKQDEAVALKK